MKKTFTTLIATSLLMTVAYAKPITDIGVYVGSECGDLCYMTFKTNKGDLTLYGYVEYYKNVKEGKIYTIVHEKASIQVAELGAIKVDAIKSIK
jgi:hypothetical protein